MPHPARTKNFHPQMQCCVLAITADPSTHEAGVDIPRGHATDMDGCVRTMRQLDPLVTRIVVYAGDALDIIYTRDGARWRVLLPDPA